MAADDVVERVAKALHENLPTHSDWQAKMLARTALEAAGYDALVAERNALRHLAGRYADHDKHCPRRHAYFQAGVVKPDCTCGYSEVLASTAPATTTTPAALPIDAPADKV